ncbi:MAG: MoaD/ThiS family protein [Actinobacteria bacterium]|nr:MAG: MoaD/ThiS family protein [Actinomycetota bacterium]
MGAGVERPAGARLGGGAARRTRVRRPGALLRDAERIHLDLAARGDAVDRGRARPPADPVGRGRAGIVAVVLLPAVLAAEAGGQKRFELDAATVGDALRQLPVQNLLFDESGHLRRLINVFVDGIDVRGGRLLDEELQADSEVRVVGAVAGG